VNVQVDGGMVTLTGEVNSWGVRQAAHHCAHSVGAVLDVANDSAVTLLMVPPIARLECRAYPPRCSGRAWGMPRLTPGVRDGFASAKRSAEVRILRLSYRRAGLALAK